MHHCVDSAFRRKLILRDVGGILTIGPDTGAVSQIQARYSPGPATGTARDELRLSGQWGRHAGSLCLVQCQAFRGRSIGRYAPSVSRLLLPSIGIAAQASAFHRGLLAVITALSIKFPLPVSLFVLLVLR